MQKRRNRKCDKMVVAELPAIHRSVGRTTGQGISQFVRVVLEANEEAPIFRKLTDVELARLIILEFPDRTNIARHFRWREEESGKEVGYLPITLEDQPGGMTHEHLDVAIRHRWVREIRFLKGCRSLLRTMRALYHSGRLGRVVNGKPERKPKIRSFRYNGEGRKVHGRTDKLYTEDELGRLREEDAQH